MSLNAGYPEFLFFKIPATELSAGTSIELVSPWTGVIDELCTIVQTAIVTGGPITVLAGAGGAVAVAGLSVTIANSATKGTVQTDTPTPGSTTRNVTKGDRIQIVPDAAFNGGGAVDGYLKINAVDLTPQ